MIDNTIITDTDKTNQQSWDRQIHRYAVLRLTTASIQYEFLPLDLSHTSGWDSLKNKTQFQLQYTHGDIFPDDRKMKMNENLLM